MARINVPKTDFEPVLIPGGVKAVKAEHRRSDALFFIPPSSIKVMTDFNVRVRDDEYLQHVREIADSMKADGFNTAYPLSVYVAREGEEDVMYLVSGHTRLEACLLAIDEGAGFAEVPVIILPKSVSLLDMTVDLVRGNSGRPLKPLELSAVVARLEKMEISETEIGEKLKLTPTYVSNLIVLAAAPRIVKTMVAKDEISATFAIAQIRKHGAKVVEVLAEARRVAEEAGKSKVTAANLPGAGQAKAMRKAAPKLLDTARAIKADPAYAKLATPVRKQLEELLATISGSGAS